MDDLIKILESFNRKERFFLVAQALGQERGGDPAFTLSDDFRQELEDKVEICIPVKDVFVAMDYHLDWVAASLAKWEAVKAGKADKSIFPNPGQKVVEGNQEDIDLLVAFDCGGQYHLILIEAKAYDNGGYAHFGNKQLKSKAARMGQIFGECGKKYDDVKPHFLLMSHNPPTARLKVSWPQWVLRGKEMPVHLKLSLPPETERRTVGRSNESGASDVRGTKFSIKSLKEESA